MNLPIELILGVTTTMTSLVAATLGLGGGLLLIAVLPAFMVPAAVIPLHGATQLASNLSRLYFSRQYIQWALLPKFLLGSLVGLALCGTLLVNLPTRYIPVFIGVYILLTIWSKRFSRFIEGYESFYLVGALQSGLGLLVGTTGPLATTMLSKMNLDKNQIIATNALFLASSHCAKIAIFIVAGFAFSEYLQLLLWMIGGAVLGSFLGTQARQLISSKAFGVILNLALTFLALRMLIKVFLA